MPMTSVSVEKEKKEDGGLSEKKNEEAECNETGRFARLTASRALMYST